MTAEAKTLTTHAAAKASEAFFRFLDREVLEARSQHKRLAISPPQQVAVPALIGGHPASAARFYFDAMLLQPNESPPKGWSLYEDE